MKEIKFRAKDRNGNWVYGLVTIVDCDNENNNTYAIVNDYCELDNIKFCGDGKVVYKPNTIIVDPNTIGQFTRLADKNGKEIYEGDIVKYSDIIGTVCFGEYGDYDYGYYIKWKQDIHWLSNKILAFIKYYSDETEVMGNIYETAQLLKEKENNKNE